MAYADELQAVSVDEALIDVTGHVAARAALPQETAVGEKGEERDPAVELAEKIRDDVRKVTDGCEGKPVSSSIRKWLKAELSEHRYCS